MLANCGRQDVKEPSKIANPKPTALIVDDDAAVCSSLSFFLEVEGFEVRTYSNSSELLGEANFPNHGCLIIDHKLPDIMGLDLLARLRQRGVELPAILITTNPSQSVCARAAAAGVALIEKPLLTEALFQAIRDALKAA